MSKSAPVWPMMSLKNRQATPVFTLSALVVAIQSAAVHAQSADSIDVSPVNTAPVIETKQLPSMIEGGFLSETISATDKEQQSLQYRLIEGPKGMEISNDGVISFKADYESAGRHDVVVEVSDGDLSSTAKMSILIDNINLPPKFTTKAPRLAKEGEVFSYRVAAEDNDGDSVTLRVSGAPLGLVMEGDTLKWEPDFEQAGSYSFAVVASDGQLESEQAITLMVENANRPPKWLDVTLADAKESELFTAQLAAEDIDSDDTLVFSLDSGPDGMDVSESGAVSWTPDFDAAGDLKVVFAVSDGDAVETLSLPLKVHNTNRAPLWKIETLDSAKEDEAYSQQLEALDEDGDGILFSLISAPEGLSLTDTGLIEFKPGFDMAGSHTVTVAVTDGDLSTNESFTLQVENTNRSPEWVTNALADAKEGEAYQLALEGTDPDQETLTYTLVAGPEGLIVDQMGQLSWDVDFDASGSHEVSLEVSDGDLSKTLTLSLAVQNTNRTPIVETAAIPAGKENESYSFGVLAADPDGDAVQWKVKTAPEGVMIGKDGVISWSPGFEAAGIHDLILAVGDGDLTTEITLPLTIENTNRAPIWTTSSFEKAAENKEFSAILQARDEDEDVVTFNLLQGPEGMTLSYTGQLFWAPDFDAAGSHDVKIAASDGDLTTEIALSLEVENTNRLPEIASEPVLVGAESAPYRYPIQYADPDGDDLVAKLISGPAGMVIENGELVWKPGFTTAGSYDIKVAVAEKNNAKAVTEQSFVLAIENTNREPVWKTEQLSAAKETVALKQQLAANDADGQSLTYRVLDAPEGLTLTEDGLLTWTPGYEQSGEYALTFIVNDSETDVEKTLVLNVANTNRKPYFVSEAIVNAAENTDYVYSIDTQDDDGNEMTLSLEKRPKGMVLEEGELRWIPGFEQAGKHAVTLRVADAESETTQTFSVAVANTNREPEFQQPEPESLVLAENTPWSLTIKADDADRQKVALSLVSGPAGMKMSRGKLIWTPGYEQAGDYEVIIRGDDSETQVDYTINVDVANTNREPRFVSKPVTSAKEDQTYRYALSVKDPDFEGHEGLQFELLEAPEGMQVSGDDAIEWTPTFDHAGSHDVVVRVTDGEAELEQKYTVIVENTNRAPVFLRESPVNLEENSEYSYSIDVEDPDQDGVELKLQEGPDGLKLDDRQLSWQLDYRSAGSYPVVLKATDGDLVTLQSFTLEVANVNREPVIESDAQLRAYESVDYKYEIIATDADNEAISYSLLQGPNGMTLSGNQVSWNPEFHQSGIHTVRLSVTDGIDTVYQQYDVSVVDTNREPTFARINDQRIMADVLYEYPLEASDVDGGVVKYKLIHAPAGMTITEENKLQWLPTAEDEGDYTVIVSVTDGDLKVRRHFELHVRTIE